MPPSRSPSTRARPGALLVLAGALLSARVVTGVYDARHPAPVGGLVRWHAPDGAEALAAAEGKPVLYDFSATWCEPCKRMERDVFANGEEADFINATYFAVRVGDEDQGQAAAALRAHHHVNSLPTLVIRNAGGGEPRRMQGYPGRRRLFGFLERSAEAAPVTQQPPQEPD